MLTFSKVTMPNMVAAIRVDGFETDPIFLKVVKDSSGPTTNDGGTHFDLTAHAQELDVDGKEILGSVGPKFASRRHGDGIALDADGILKEKRHVRREAVKAFLSMRRISGEVVPDNLVEVEGELLEPPPEI
jgi:hypothetical protein